MSNYDNTNRFSLWPNRDKQSDTHPDFSGTINVDGKEYFIDGWKRREGANPKAPSLSGRVKLKEVQQPKDYSGNRQAAAQQPDQFAGGNDFDDPLPF